MAACKPAPTDRHADSAAATTADAGARGATDPRRLAATRERLSHAAGGADGTAYTVSNASADGRVTGTVSGPPAPPDTTVVPTHDLVACPRFREPLYPTKGDGVGDAVVWLAGVAAGRRDDAPRRITLMLQDCRLEPRVQRVASGGTVLVNSRDAMQARLRFVESGPDGTLRTTVSLNDAGQVVPTGAASATPGIVAVRDDLHPWVRGYLAVTPHPYVAITDATGAFTIDGVPPGKYTLMVWHERYGTHAQPVTVGAAPVTVNMRVSETGAR